MARNHFLNNIQFSEEGLKVWKACNIGRAKSIPWENCNAPGQEKGLSIKNSLATKSSFVTVKPRKTDNLPSHSQKQDCPQKCPANANEETHRGHDQQLFTCPREGSIKSYQIYSALQKHLDCGNHKRALESETLFDRFWDTHRHWKEVKTPSPKLLAISIIILPMVQFYRWGGL